MTLSLPLGYSILKILRSQKESETLGGERACPIHTTSLGERASSRLSDPGSMSTATKLDSVKHQALARPLGPPVESSVDGRITVKLE